MRDCFLVAAVVVVDGGGVFANCVVIIAVAVDVVTIVVIVVQKKVVSFTLYKHCIGRCTCSIAQQCRAIFRELVTIVTVW